MGMEIYKGKNTHGRMRPSKGSGRAIKVTKKIPKIKDKQCVFNS